MWGQDDPFGPAPGFETAVNEAAAAAPPFVQGTIAEVPNVVDRFLPSPDKTINLFGIETNAREYFVELGLGALIAWGSSALMGASDKDRQKALYLGAMVGGSLNLFRNR